jgi:hypothetical protein
MVPTRTTPGYAEDASCFAPTHTGGGHKRAADASRSKCPSPLQKKRGTVLVDRDSCRKASEMLKTVIFIDAKDRRARERIEKIQEIK